MNRVCEILGINKPVVQTPMTWITNPELVAAVSSAASLIKSIDSCEGIVNELAKGYGC